MKRRSWIALALVAYVLAIIVNAPATLIDAGLLRASQGKLRLVEAQGTLWSGTGLIEMRDAGGRSGVATGITWRIFALSMLGGELAGEIKLGNASKPFPITVGLNRVELTDADLNLPASALSLFVPKIAALGITGDIFLHIARFSSKHGQMQGSVNLKWHDAGSVHTPVSPLGDYELLIDADGAELHALLRTTKGPLQLDGEGGWSKGKEADLRVTARVPYEYQQQLAPLLRLVAVEHSNGSFEMRLR